MTHVIVSDVHLGSRSCQRDRFAHFLESLPDDIELVLNGDTLHVPPDALNHEDKVVFNLLLQQSRERRVVFVYGNHDLPFELTRYESLSFVSEHVIASRLCVNHGDAFMPAQRILNALGAMIRPFRVQISGEPLLSANVLQKVPTVFAYLSGAVMRNAASHAVENGYEAITCGHLHEMREDVCRGVRYYNTGTWTMWPAYCLIVEDGSIRMERGDCFDVL